MFNKLWTAAKVWWENRKSVVIDFVLPKLDLAIEPLAHFLIGRGIPQASAVAVSKDTIAWVKDYLKRQL
ncbi:MAG: hypothetical protein A2293_17085 [Elusimicrobia bacterium RIFOXYB2_FULL_49_7]|nr:MAG: hypothetical protein A2293_17085 [Elusimicrobia bacterium RIFOXYB2_FULL_49_7]